VHVKRDFVDSSNWLAPYICYNGNRDVAVSMTKRLVCCHSIRGRCTQLTR
jgi:hypothetical protein